MVTRQANINNMECTFPLPLIRHQYLFLVIHMDAAICCSVAKLCLILCEPMDSSTLGFPVLH